MLQPRQLAPFFADLRSSGFSVGPIEQQRVIDLLLQLELSDAIPDNSERLCNMMGAVLCCSTEQQLAFRQRFSAYFGTWTRERRSRRRELIELSLGGTEGDIGPSSPPNDPDPGPSGLTELERKAISRIVFAFVLLITLSILLPHWLVYMGWLKIEVVQSTAPQGQVSTAAIKAPPPQAPQTQHASVPSPAPSLAERLSRLIDSLSKVLEAPRVAWSGVAETVGFWGIFLLIPAFGVAGMWAVAPVRSPSAYLRRRELQSRPELIQLLVNTAHDNPFSDVGLPRLAQMLRRPRLVPSEEMDVDASLERTIVNCGLFTPVTSSRPIAPEHLILIDRRSKADHLFRYAELLVSALREAHVYVDVYWFNSDIRRLFRAADTPAISIEEAAGKYPEHRLVLITSGERLFDPSSALPHAWTIVLRQFARRVLLTPVPRELWGYRERMLDIELELPVLPLVPESVQQIVEILTAEESLCFKPAAPRTSMATAALTHLADVLENRPVRWIESTTPNVEEIAMLQAALRDGLSPAAYDWLSAAAVYPELTWNLTLHIGKNLSGPISSEPVGAERILEISRLPWFRLGRMPEWLRGALANDMRTELYVRTRHLLSALLLTVFRSGTKNQPLRAEIERQGAEKAAALKRSELRIHDSLLVDFLSRPRHDRSLYRLPQVIARLFRRGGAVRGWLRELFSREHVIEVTEAAQLLTAVIVDASVVRLQVQLPDGSSEDPGRDFRRVVRMEDDHGTEQSVADTVLYLPVGNEPARLLDSGTFDLHERRRQTARKLALINAGLATLIVGMVSGKDMIMQSGSIGVATLAAVAWMAGPFLLLHMMLVRPIRRCFEFFPEFVALGDAMPFESVQFSRGTSRRDAPPGDVDPEPSQPPTNSTARGDHPLAG